MRHIELASGASLPLRNSGELDLFFVGVGSAFSKKNSNTSMILVKGEHHLAIDVGRNWPEALGANAGLDMGDITAAFISHSHSDHANGVVDWLLYHRYCKSMGNVSKAVRPQVIITKEFQHYLWEHTLRGGLEWNELDGAGKRLGFGDFVEVVRPCWKANQPREIFEVDFPESEPDVKKRIHLEIFRTNHIPEQKDNWADCFTSYGLLVDGHVFLSLDTKFDPELIDLYSDRSSVMFNDVQFFPGAVHPPLADLRELSDEVKRKMFFMHYSDNWLEQDIKGFAGFASNRTIYRFPARV